jgi:hypothetical protein
MTDEAGSLPTENNSNTIVFTVRWKDDEQDDERLSAQFVTWVTVIICVLFPSAHPCQ